MFENSLSLIVRALIINILVPLIPGILVMQLVFGNLLKGTMLLLMSWLVGFGVVAFSLFNLQFLYQGIGWSEYGVLILVLVIAWGVKHVLTHTSMVSSIKQWKLEFISSKELIDGYQNLSIRERGGTLIGIVIGCWFLVITFVHNVSFPTFFDDAFGNWNRPAIQIMYDDGVKMFGSTGEILGRGRLGYPIFAPLYKAQIATMLGGWYDIVMNLWNWLGFLVLIMLSWIITYHHIRNLWYSSIPTILICGLPLVYFHVVDGYMDLPSAIYAVATIYAFYQFVSVKEYRWLVLGMLLGCILSNIKNDGIIVYFPPLILALIGYLLRQKTFLQELKDFFSKSSQWLTLIGIIVYTMVPWLALKTYYGLGFNQAAGESSGVGVSDTVHREIFSVFKPIFFDANNYNIILGTLILVGIIAYHLYHKKKGPQFLIIGSFVAIMAVLIAVFLLTSNYRFALDQTTINRVFTMGFVVLSFYMGILIHDKNT